MVSKPFKMTVNVGTKDVAYSRPASARPASRMSRLSYASHAKDVDVLSLISSHHRASPANMSKVIDEEECKEEHGICLFYRGFKDKPMEVIYQRWMLHTKRRTLIYFSACNVLITLSALILLTSTLNGDLLVQFVVCALSLAISLTLCVLCSLRTLPSGVHAVLPYSVWLCALLQVLLNAVLYYPGAPLDLSFGWVTLVSFCCYAMLPLKCVLCVLLSAITGVLYIVVVIVFTLQGSYRNAYFLVHEVRNITNYTVGYCICSSSQ